MKKKPASKSRNSKASQPERLTVAGVEIPAGVRQRVELRVSRLATETWLSIPVEVVSGVRPGPCIWLSGAVHGDELNGVEVVRQVLGHVSPENLSGTLIGVPIVNVFGFISQSRNLPDRRDLNRSFPGSNKGSLASRIAHLFMTEIVQRCSYGIDLHTGANHRTNLPQIRANLKDAETRRIAEAFGAPVMLHAQTRDGSLRQAATHTGVHVLLFEAGEPLRFNLECISAGVDGTMRVLEALGMWSEPVRAANRTPREARETSWIRARRGGILRLNCSLGSMVQRGELLGVVSDAFGDNELKLRAPNAGVVIGHTNNPYVNAGDGVLHLAELVDP